MKTLSFHIHDLHHKEQFFKGSLPLTWVPLSQKSIDTLGAELEQYINFESLVEYQSSQTYRYVVDSYLSQV